MLVDINPDSSKVAISSPSENEPGFAQSWSGVSSKNTSKVAPGGVMTTPTFEPGLKKMGGGPAEVNLRVKKAVASPGGNPPVPSKKGPGTPSMKAI